MSAQEQRKQYKDMLNWTKSLDRRTPLSPPRDGQSPEGTSDCRREVNNSSPTVEVTPCVGTHLKESGELGRSESQPTSSLSVREAAENSVPPSSSDTAVVTGKPPLPPLAMEGRREEKYQLTRGGGGSGTAAPQPADETDSGARRYIAQMRARGHKRASSAPTHFQSPPAAGIPQIPHIVVNNSEGLRETATRRVKVWLYQRYCML